VRTFVEDRWASEEHRRPEMMTCLLDLQAARVDAHKATQSNRAVRGRTYFINCFGAPRMCAVQRGLGRRHCRQSCCLHRRNPLTHSPQPYSKTHTHIYIYREGHDHPRTDGITAMAAATCYHHRQQKLGPEPQHQELWQPPRPTDMRLSETSPDGLRPPQIKPFYGEKLTPSANPQAQLQS